MSLLYVIKYIIRYSLLCFPLFCVSAVCFVSLYSVSLLYVIKYILRASLLSLIFLSE